MRRSRSHLNNLTANQSAGQGGPHAPQFPVGASQQIEEIGRRLSALGMNVQRESHQQSHYQPYPPQQQAYGQPQPAYGPDPELDHIRSSLDHIASKLGSLGQQGQGSRQTEALVRQNEQITAELLEMRKQLASINKQDSSALATEIDKVRQSLEASHTEIARRLAETHNGAQDEKYARVVEASHERISNELQGLHSAMGELANMSGGTAGTFDARHEELLQQVSGLHEAVNAASANPQFYAETIENSHRELLSGFGELKEMIQQAGEQSSSSFAPDLGNMEMRLEEITRAVVALSAGSPAIDNLERIEARITDIGKIVAGLNPGEGGDQLSRIEGEISSLRDQLAANDSQTDSGSSALEQQMAEVRESLNELNNSFTEANHAPAADLADMAAQVARLSDKFDNRAALVSSTEDGDAASINADAMIARLDELVMQVSDLRAQPMDLSPIQAMFDQVQSPDHSNAFAALEQQLGEILGRLGEAEREPVSFDPITDRLTGIEQQIGASRDIAIEVAAQAAEEAIERTLRELPAQAEASNGISTEAIDNLTHDLKRWQESISGASAENNETFDALKEVLNTIADRLSQIEQGMHSGIAPSHQPDVAPMVAEAPEPKHRDAIIEEPADASPSIPVSNLVSGAETHNHSPVHHDEAPVDSQAGENVQMGTNPLYAAALDEVGRPAGSGGHPADFASEATVPVDNANAYAYPEVDAPAMEMPDAAEGENFAADDTPLEPGTGAPDLAALVKQANERRKSGDKHGSVNSGMDFLASARRAAQAAAQEASMAQERIEIEKKQGRFSVVSDLVSKNKRALIIGATALLFAALAVPLANTFLGSDPAPVEETPVVEQTLEPTSEPLADEEIEVDQQLADPVLDSEQIPAETSAPETSVIEETPPVEDLEAVGEPDTVSGNEQAVEPIATESIQSATLELAQPEQGSLLSYDTSGLGFANEALKSAVASADPTALFEVARRYSEGAGTQRDLAKAAKWYERSAELGFAPAQYIIGNFNEKGIGVEKNMARAVSWYELAADSGNIVAMHNLGVIYATPGAVASEPDMQNAFRWFSEAAEHGVRDSQVNMGIFYTRGIGTDVDLVEAYKWFAVAAASGDKDAESKLGVIREALRPDQFEAAKTIVENWSPSTADQAANEVKSVKAWGGPSTVTAATEKQPPLSKSTIAQVQAVLASLGYDPGPADGIMGQRTRDAIAAYQKQTGLEAGGQVDAALLRSLTAAISG